MSELSDELKILNSAISFATDNKFDYVITRYHSISGFKHIDVQLGKGPIHSIPENFFGASFAVDNKGKSVYRQIHVFPLNYDYMYQTEELRLYLEKELPDLEVAW